MKFDERQTDTYPRHPESKECITQKNPLNIGQTATMFILSCRFGFLGLRRRGVHTQVLEGLPPVLLSLETIPTLFPSLSSFQCGYSKRKERSLVEIPKLSNVSQPRVTGLLQNHPPCLQTNKLFGTSLYIKNLFGPLRSK